MTATTKAKPRVFRRAVQELFEGVLLDWVEDNNTGHIQLVMDTGTVTMPGTWNVRFDMFEGMTIKAGWEHGMFILEDLTDYTVVEIPE